MAEIDEGARWTLVRPGSFLRLLIARPVSLCVTFPINRARIIVAEPGSRPANCAWPSANILLGLSSLHQRRHILFDNSPKLLHSVAFDPPGHGRSASDGKKGR